ncbi:hypothetical protein DFH06DRAFT_1129881 [Mycena polygramma]|nr:hypothetical protein DFH06DRAFT_1129881 [Mycena polygramma]
MIRAHLNIKVLRSREGRVTWGLAATLSQERMTMAKFDIQHSISRLRNHINFAPIFLSLGKIGVLLTVAKLAPMALTYLQSSKDSKGQGKMSWALTSARTLINPFFCNIGFGSSTSKPALAHVWLLQNLTKGQCQDHPGSLVGTIAGEITAPAFVLALDLVKSRVGLGDLLHYLPYASRDIVLKTQHAGLSGRRKLFRRRSPSPASRHLYATPRTCERLHYLLARKCSTYLHANPTPGAGSFKVSGGPLETWCIHILLIRCVIHSGAHLSSTARRLIKMQKLNLYISTPPRAPLADTGRQHIRAWNVPKLGCHLESPVVLAHGHSSWVFAGSKVYHNGARLEIIAQTPQCFYSPHVKLFAGAKTAGFAKVAAGSRRAVGVEGSSGNRRMLQGKCIPIEHTNLIAPSTLGWLGVCASSENHGVRCWCRDSSPLV